MPTSELGPRLGNTAGSVSWYCAILLACASRTKTARKGLQAWHGAMSLLAVVRARSSLIGLQQSARYSLKPQECQCASFHHMLCYLFSVDYKALAIGVLVSFLCLCSICLLKLSHEGFL
jgi:hypothetical protein